MNVVISQKPSIVNLKGGLSPFHRRLHEWYGRQGRKDLPWRNTTDPYAIYLSEIMLQQTQVKTVLERYYFQFLKRFPTLARLAEADQDTILQAWQGLGYYNRALNLHKAAKQIIRDWDSGFRIQGKKTADSLIPESRILIPRLMSLPGIGRNTAHAIAAFAFRQPVAVMEANARRALSRIFAMENPSEAELWEKAELILDKSSPFDYNQAMMDIGAMVCTRRAPLCAECPANIICRGKTSPESYPAAKSKKPVPVRRKHIIVLRNPQGQYYATPRTSRFLNGLYHFMEVDSPPPLGGRPGGGHDGHRPSHTRPHPNPPPNGEGIFLGSIRQQYSHFTLEAGVFLMESNKKTNSWYSLAELQQLPMSMAEKKILALLKLQLSTHD